MNWLRSLLRRIRGFFRLDSAQRRAFLGAVASLPMTRRRLRHKNLTEVQAQMDTRRPSAWIAASDETTAQARSLAKAIHLAADHGVGESNCLPRSLVLWSQLRRKGLEAQLRIGVAASPDAGPRFHAWVEHNTEVVNDAADVAERYLPFKGAIEPGQTRF